MAVLLGETPPPLVPRTTKFAQIISLNSNTHDLLRPQLVTKLPSTTADSNVDPNSTIGMDYSKKSSKELCDFGIAEFDDTEDDDLKTLQTNYERSREERKREQDLAAQERQRLEEILKLCSEYDSHFDRDKEKKPRLLDERKEFRSSWGSTTKIKTNGSLTSLANHAHSRRSDDVTMTSADNYVNTNETTNRDRDSDGRIRFQPDVTGSGRIITTSCSRIFKLSKDFASTNLENCADFVANSSSTLSDLNDVFEDDSVRIQKEPNSVNYERRNEVDFHTRYLVESGNVDKYEGTGNVTRACREAIPSPSNCCGTGTKICMPGYQPPYRDRRWQKSVDDAKERIKVLRRRIIDVANLEEKTINETQAELDLLQWEYNGLIEQLQREEERISVINQQQMELLLEATRGRDEAERQIEEERRRLQMMEQRLHETKKKRKTHDVIDGVTSGDVIEKQTEEVERQRRLFDDLEFHLLEIETRREEEREPQHRKLTAELNQLQNSRQLVQETMKQLNEQKGNLVSQVKSDVVDLEKERLLLIEDFRKEKVKLSRLLNEDAGAIFQPPSPAVSSPKIGDQNIPYKPQTSPTESLGASEFSADGADGAGGDDSLLLQTPLSTFSVLQQLQELEKHSQIAENHGPDVDSHVVDDDDDVAAVDNDVILSSMSLDGLNFWLRDDNHLDEHNHHRPTGAKYFTRSDEDISVASIDDHFQELSFTTNSFCSQAKLGVDDDYPPEDDDNSIDRYYPHDDQSVAEDSVDRKETTEEFPEKRCRFATGGSEVEMRPTNRIQQSRPMTRYLPVRGSADLDLRQFVESSGHRLDCNGHVHVTSFSCRGSLVKLGRRFRLWHRRWFVFDRKRRCIEYFRDQTERKLRGSFPFCAIEDVFVDHLRTVRSPSPKLTFCLKTTAKSFFLVAPSPETMRIWIDVLFTGAEGYQEFS